jgi:hypothetical protein
MRIQKKFISIVWGYHNQIFLFDRDQNYHMLPIETMKEDGYICEIYAIDSQVKIEDDPSFIQGTRVIYYKNFFQYILYQDSNCMIYSKTCIFLSS